MTVNAYSNKKYFWRCREGHNYVAAPEKLMRRNKRCPICVSFGYVHPDAAKEWHPTKNGDLNPYELSEKSQKEAWFICSKCGSEYNVRIAYRASRKSDNCPYCKEKSSLCGRIWKTHLFCAKYLDLRRSFSNFQTVKHLSDTAEIFSIKTNKAHMISYFVFKLVDQTTWEKRKAPYYYSCELVKS